MSTAGRHYLSKPVGQPPSSKSAATSNSMRANRGFGTRPEQMLAHALRKKLSRADLPGTPDIVYMREKLAVFVHGCFWHRCPRCNLPLPRTHRAYWQRKFERNVERDNLVRKELERVGWRVYVAWEHEVSANPRRIVMQIRAALAKR